MNPSSSIQGRCLNKALACGSAGRDRFVEQGQRAAILSVQPIPRLPLLLHSDRPAILRGSGIPSCQPRRRLTITFLGCSPPGGLWSGGILGRRGPPGEQALTPPWSIGSQPKDIGGGVGRSRWTGINDAAARCDWLERRRSAVGRGDTRAPRRVPVARRRDTAVAGSPSPDAFPQTWHRTLRRRRVRIFSLFSLSVDDMAAFPRRSL